MGTRIKKNRRVLGPLKQMFDMAFREAHETKDFSHADRLWKRMQPLFDPRYVNLKQAQRDYERAKLRAISHEVPLKNEAIVEPVHDTGSGGNPSVVSETEVSNQEATLQGEKSDQSDNENDGRVP